MKATSQPKKLFDGEPLSLNVHSVMAPLLAARILFKLFKFKASVPFKVIKLAIQQMCASSSQAG